MWRKKDIKRMHVSWFLEWEREWEEGFSALLESLEDGCMLRAKRARVGFKAVCWSG